MHLYLGEAFQSYKGGGLLPQRSGWLLDKKSSYKVCKGGSHISLDSYLNRTPASDFYPDKGFCKSALNIKEGSQTLFNALNPYLEKYLLLH